MIGIRFLYAEVWVLLPCVSIEKAVYDVMDLKTKDLKKLEGYSVRSSFASFKGNMASASGSIDEPPYV